MIYVSELKTSGTNVHCLCTADHARELRRLARRLRLVVKVDARGQHLDLRPHQRELAIEYGAIDARQA
jgi:hypothetical protein